MTQIKDLLEHATPLPWGDPSEYQYGDNGWYIPGSPLGEVDDTDQALTDLTLATVAVNRIPDYEALREAVEYYFDPVRFLPGVESVAEKTMLAALYRLRAEGRP